MQYGARADRLEHPPATRPTSNVRSPRFIRSRSMAATSRSNSQRADHTVWGSDQVVLPQPLEPLVLLLCHPGGLVPIRPESRSVELADDLGTARFLLVRVNLVAPGQPEGAESRARLAHSQQIAGDPAHGNRATGHHLRRSGHIFRASLSLSLFGIFSETEALGGALIRVVGRDDNRRCWSGRALRVRRGVSEAFAGRSNPL